MARVFITGSADGLGQMAAELLVAAGHAVVLHARNQWLATSDAPAAKVTCGYFYHLKPRKPNPDAGNEAIQDRFMDECARLSGVSFTSSSH